MIWEKVGRSWYAKVGPCSISVRRLPRLGMDPRWMVRSVFGNSFADHAVYSSLADAQLAAERVARRYIKELAALAEKGGV